MDDDRMRKLLEEHAQDCQRTLRSCRVAVWWCLLSLVIDASMTLIRMVCQ